jgi:multidrug efflux pump subunit AcrB
VNVSAWCIRNPIPSVMFFVLLTVAGLLGFRAMKIQQFPDIDLPTVVVSASLPGAAPAQMETEVARKIENAVASLQGVKNLYTKVQDGVAQVTVEFRLERATQEALDDVRSAVSRIRADLPADVRDPVVTKLDLAGAPILTYTVASSRMDEEALSWFVDNTVTKAMLAARGVGAVARVGGATREVRVELDPARLLALNITAAEVSRQLRTVAMVRTLCSAPPRSVRPPGASCCTARSWRETSLAVRFSASSRAGSSSTRTSRVAPPTRETAPTPRTASIALVTVLSTNQDSASSSMRLEATV